MTAHSVQDEPPTAPLVAWDDAGVWQRSGFASFLQSHGIQRSDLVAREGNGAKFAERRFFRVKRSDALQTDDDVVTRVAQSLQQQQQLATGENDDDTEPQCRPEPWVPGFFSLPASTRLAGIDLYQNGELYGIDISSGFAVTLLDVQPGDHVLDLCCAPGAKLTMIADLLRMRGSVTGVDFSRPRIGACKQLVHKYKLVRPLPTTTERGDGASTDWRCRLFHADGRTFAVRPASEWDPLASGAFEAVLDSDEIASRAAKSQGRKRQNKSARAREAAKRLRRTDEPVTEASTVDEGSGRLYNRVLVDAECTHDGSTKHLQKLQTEAAWAAYVADHLNATEIARILALQAALLCNGFALLRAGGRLVYSTCSLSIQQNEQIVERFLAATPSATLEPIDTAGIPCEPGKLAGTVRFTPAHHTSGLFIAKIRKLEA